LDVTNGSTVNGVKMQIWDCTAGDTNQVCICFSYFRSSQANVPVFSSWLSPPTRESRGVEWVNVWILLMGAWHLGIRFVLIRLMWDDVLMRMIFRCNCGLVRPGIQIKFGTSSKPIALRKMIQSELKLSCSPDRTHSSCPLLWAILGLSSLNLINCYRTGL